MVRGVSSIDTMLENRTLFILAYVAGEVFKPLLERLILYLRYSFPNLLRYDSGKPASYSIVLSFTRVPIAYRFLNFIKFGNLYKTVLIFFLA